MIKFDAINKTAYYRAVKEQILKRFNLCEHDINVNTKNINIYSTLLISL